jgi:hypothetical protein
MEMMRHTESLREKYGLEKPEVSDWQQSASEKEYGALKSLKESALQGLSNTPMEDNAPMVDMESVLSRKKAQDEASFSMVPQFGPFEGKKLYHGTPEYEEFSTWRETSPQWQIYRDEIRAPGSRRHLNVKDAIAKAKDYEEPVAEDKSWIQRLLGRQMGGMMPGGVSNALPYNIGGSVQQQPMAYQLGGLLKYKRSPMMG